LRRGQWRTRTRPARPDSEPQESKTTGFPGLCRCVFARCPTSVVTIQAAFRSSDGWGPPPPGMGRYPQALAYYAHAGADGAPALPAWVRRTASRSNRRLGLSRKRAHRHSTACVRTEQSSFSASLSTRWVFYRFAAVCSIRTVDGSCRSKSPFIFLGRECILGPSDAPRSGMCLFHFSCGCSDASSRTGRRHPLRRVRHRLERASGVSAIWTAARRSLSVWLRHLSVGAITASDPRQMRRTGCR